MTQSQYHDDEYTALVERILESGIQKGDRTGTGTISLFAQQMRFGLSGGSIPLLTTKKMFTRGVIHEILWYLQGATNIKYLTDNNVHIWDEWSSPEGHLNNVYGAQWRRWENDEWLSSVVEVKLKSDCGTNLPFVPPPNTTDLTIDESSTDDLVGSRNTNNDGDEFVVIRKVSTTGSKNSQYLIFFTQTESIVECNRPNLRRGQVRDPYKKTVFGEGCIGVYGETPKYYTAAYNMWYNMMRRCYDSNIPEYQLYGGAGVFVDQRWRCFSNFIRDIHELPWFSKWKETPSEYDLDKDYYGATCYGKETCLFLPTRYNQALPNLDGSKYIATNNETGKTAEFTVQRWFAEQVGIEHSQAISTALQSTGNTNGWHFKRISPKKGYAFRQEMVIDQIGQVIHQLRNNPNDRRIIVSAWNVAQIEDMNLPPCHLLFQFWSRELNEQEKDLTGKERALSCHLYQRSCDTGLGVPFNIVQYSILTHMVAQVTGHVAEEFVWTGGDTHIYNNHIDALKEQISRDPYPSPTLKLNPDVTEIDDFKFDDFEIVGYQHHPLIKMEVSV